MPVSEADVIAAARAETLAPSTWSDEDLMEVMEGTWWLQRIRFRLAWLDLRDVVWCAIRDSFARCKR